jgi:hypothetical protein
MSYRYNYRTATNIATNYLQNRTSDFEAHMYRMLDLKCEICNRELEYYKYKCHNNHNKVLCYSCSKISTYDCTNCNKRWCQCVEHFETDIEGFRRCPDCVDKISKCDCGRFKIYVCNSIGGCDFDTTASCNKCDLQYCSKCGGHTCTRLCKKCIDYHLEYRCEECKERLCSLSKMNCTKCNRLVCKKKCQTRGYCKDCTEPKRKVVSLLEILGPDICKMIEGQLKCMNEENQVKNKKIEHGWKKCKLCLKNLPTVKSRTIKCFSCDNESNYTKICDECEKNIPNSHLKKIGNFERHEESRAILCRLCWY